ncbi:MAG: hydantoinase/oxoprolinase family protein [Desulfobacterium sp.]
MEDEKIIHIIGCGGLALENGIDSVPDTESALAGREPPRHLVYDEEKNDGLSISIHYGLGIDAGGTYTDAVVYDFDDKKNVDKNKALTTKWDFSIGIDEVLSGIDPDVLSKVELVSVSTTLATNAIVEGEGQKTGLILMVSGGIVSEDLISHTPKCNVKGHINISGGEVEPVDEDEIRKAVHHMVDKEGVTAFAVSGFAGAVNPAHELAVKRIINEETGLVVCCGHELSDMLNFVVRAQTAVLNARIIPRMIKFFKELGSVLKKRGIHAPVMVVKGDGTLMSAAMAEERPVETVLSGPAASVAGARRLTGLDEAMVVDMGGTTTDTAYISKGLVGVCEIGANVGGFVTHVKALDMRTVGLGGDSLIRWIRDEFVIGPRRVGPIVWANATHPQGVKSALQYMKNHRLSIISQTILVAMEGKFSFEPTPNEQKVYDLLRQRPHAPEELLPHLNIQSVKSIPLERLEESGLVQRCGLTPTDILHVTGEFTKWDAEPAHSMLYSISSFSKKSKEELIDTLLNQIEMDLALELLKKQMSRDFAMDEMENTPVFKQLMKQIVSPGNSLYNISAQFNHPIIGIGAPVHYFLPQVGKRLNAQVIIPEDADVANAVGAITSHILIKQKLSIKTNSSGNFIVEGIAGNQQFTNIGQAEAWAVKYLKNHIQELGRCAGTSSKTVAMDIENRVVNTGGGGTPIFLGRTIVATLSGNPDRVLRAVNE